MLKKILYTNFLFVTTVTFLSIKNVDARSINFFQQQQQTTPEITQEETQEKGQEKPARNFSTTPEDATTKKKKKTPVNVTYDVLKVGDYVKSEFPDMTVVPSKSRQKKALPYRTIREEDVLFRAKIWREIPTTEKINTPFRYEIEEDNGDQRFIMILLKGIKEKKIQAYSAIDDRFTTPISYEELPDMIVGEPEIVPITDWETDPTGQTKKDSLIVNEFNPNSIEIYRVKEEWIFDKITSRLYCRTMGIAPLKNVYNANGSFRGRAVIFWVYYPKCRDYFATWEVYNSKNLNHRMTWEELWESKYYSSYITKSLIDNPYNFNIASYITNPILRLVEGDKIKNKIFDIEQSLWSY